MTAKRWNERWNELTPKTRRFIVTSAIAEGVLKLIALVDLARRPAAQVRGSKRRWAAAIVLVNSFGLVPISYLVRGRHAPGTSGRSASGRSASGRSASGR